MARADREGDIAQGAAHPEQVRPSHSPHSVASLVSPTLTTLSSRGNPESKTRQLNDEINKLLREKRHWERRIVELGGANHSRAGDPQLLDENGNELPGSRGYRYFGAARDLPGVRDLFSKAPANSSDVRRSRGDMNKFVDSACVSPSTRPTCAVFKPFSRVACRYYGFRDDDDGELVPAEAAAEAAGSHRLSASRVLF